MKSFPWNSIIDGIDPESGFPVYDRPYDAEDFRDVMQRFFTDGIFSDTPLGFGVTAGTGMTVNVQGGSCMISGTNGIETESRTLMIQAAHASWPRIDTVVLRWNSDIDERNIDLYVIQGEPAKVPERPALTRLKGSIWELGLCDILIPAKSTSVSNVNLSDTRLDPTRCGIVTPFTEFDSSSLYKVLKAKVDEMVELTKSALDGTTAGHLQNQIDDKQDQIDHLNDYTTGINLLRGTRDFAEGSVKSSISTSYIDGFTLQGSWNKTVDNEGFTELSGQMTTSRAFFSSPFEVVEGESYTLSFDVKMDKVDLSQLNTLNWQSWYQMGSIFVYADSAAEVIAGIILQNVKKNEKNSGWCKYVNTFTASKSGLAYVRVQLPNYSDTIHLKCFKVEVNQVNNPIWSASPFDVAQDREVVHKSGDTMTGDLTINSSTSGGVNIGKITVGDNIELATDESGSYIYFSKGVKGNNFSISNKYGDVSFIYPAAGADNGTLAMTINGKDSTVNFPKNPTVDTFNELPIPAVLVGSKSCSVSSVGYTDYSVTFDEELPSVPFVILERSSIGANTSSGAEAASAITITRRDTSTTGFTIRIHSATDQSITTTVHWIAIVYK